jgi:hypothetical protein
MQLSLRTTLRETPEAIGPLRALFARRGHIEAMHNVNSRHFFSIPRQAGCFKVDVGESTGVSPPWFNQPECNRWRSSCTCQNY